MAQQDTVRTPQSAPPSKSPERLEFDEVMLAETGHLMNYAVSLTHDRDRARDLVQDCLLRALENWHQFHRGTHMRRWLFTILRNSHLDDRRRHVRHGPSVPFDDVPEKGALSQPPAQEDWIALKECERKLSKARPCDRDILLLSVFSRLSHKEIAERLDVAEGTVRSRLSRIRTDLRE